MNHILYLHILILVQCLDAILILTGANHLHLGTGHKSGQKQEKYSMRERNNIEILSAREKTPTLRSSKVEDSYLLTQFGNMNFPRTISPPVYLADSSFTATTTLNHDAQSDLETILERTLQLHVLRGQRVTLTTPSALQASIDQTQFIKLSAELVEKKRPMSLYAGSGVHSNTTTILSEHKMNTQQLLPPPTAAYSARRYQVARGRVARKLANETCIAIVAKSPSLHMKLFQEGRRLPQSCAEAFTTGWFPKPTLRRILYNNTSGGFSKNPMNVSARAINGQRSENRQLHSPSSLMLNTSDILATTICGGQWVPRGGFLDDITSDPVLSFPDYFDSIVFKISSDSLESIEKASPNFKLSFIDSEVYGNRRGEIQEVNSSPTVSSISSARNLTNFPDVLPSLMKPSMLLDSLSQTRYDDANVNVLYGDFEWKICVYPSSFPDPSIFPHDAGSLYFVTPASLTPGYRRQLKVPVRVFLNPGWSLGVSVTGYNFTDSENLLSLKLEDCSGFFDSLSFRSTHPRYVKQATRDSKSLDSASSFSNALNIAFPQHDIRQKPKVLEEAFFSFDVNFKSEESDLPEWHVRHLENLYSPRYRLRNGSLQHLWKSHDGIPFSGTVKIPHGEKLDFVLNSPNMSSKTIISRRLGSLSMTESIPADVIVTFKLCFFNHRNQLNGTELGLVAFYSDHEDSAELVGFIIFTIIGVPFTCGLTLSCYSYRHRKLRKRLRRLRLLQQRDEIERRLSHHLGFDRQSVSSSSDDDDHEDRTRKKQSA